MHQMILTSIAKKHGTDKADGHFYTSHYETHFINLETN